MNPMEEDPSKNEHLQELVEELTQQIGQLFSNNDQIREILENIEKEGYQVDLVVASLSRILSNETFEGEEDEIYELNPFDYAFLQAIKVKP
jgi:regulator of replication initiation timing